MKSESVRRLDELGRIVLPGEMRNALGWDKDTKISVTQDGERLVLQAYSGSCVVCGSEENIRPVKSKFICQSCMDEVNK